MTKATDLAFSCLSILALGTAAFAEPAASKDDLKVSGFADLQYRTNNRHVPSTSSPDYNNSFSVYDGAIYLNKDFGGLAATVDLPFTGGLNTGNGFTVGGTKPQAFVEAKYASGLRWKFGQFDTIYGFEVNDSVDNLFSSQGILFSNALPLTHTGVLLGFDPNSEFSINLMAANPHDQGSMSGKKPEFGTQLGYKTANYRATLGYLAGKSATLEESNSLVNLTAGATFGALATDLELDVRKAAGVADKGKGVLLNFAYTCSDAWTAGLRLEGSKDLIGINEATVASYRGNQVTVGPQYTLAKNAKLKVDYTHSSVTATNGATAVKTHTMAISTVVRF